MRIKKHRTAFCEAVDMGSFDLWVTIEAANPIVLIVDGNKQNVGFLRAERRRGQKEGEQTKQAKWHCVPHGNLEGAGERP